MIGLLDLGTGNILSVYKALKRAAGNKFQVNIINDARALKSCNKLVMPGVGNFKNGIEKISSLNIKYELDELVLVKKVPVLGICLGMQLMTKFSTEGNIEGLGWIDISFDKFQIDKIGIRKNVPHVGWNTVINLQNHNSRLFEGITRRDFFYFVHSYMALPTEDPKDDLRLFYSNYGITFVSAFEKENILGLQFHPEKSYQPGIKLLENFLKRF